MGARILAADSAARGHPPSGDVSGGIAATDNATQAATIATAADRPISARGATDSLRRRPRSPRTRSGPAMRDTGRWGDQRSYSEFGEIRHSLITAHTVAAAAHRPNCRAMPCVPAAATASATSVRIAAGIPHSGADAKSPDTGQTTTRQAMIGRATIGSGGGVPPMH